MALGICSSSSTSFLCCSCFWSSFCVFCPAPPPPRPSSCRSRAPPPISRRPSSPGRRAARRSCGRRRRGFLESTTRTATCRRRSASLRAASRRDAESRASAAGAQEAAKVTPRRRSATAERRPSQLAPDFTRKTATDADLVKHSPAHRARTRVGRRTRRIYHAVAPVLVLRRRRGANCGAAPSADRGGEARSAGTSGCGGTPEPCRLFDVHRRRRVKHAFLADAARSLTSHPSSATCLLLPSCALPGPTRHRRVFPVGACALPAAPQSARPSTSGRVRDGGRPTRHLSDGAARPVRASERPPLSSRVPRISARATTGAGGLVEAVRDRPRPRSRLDAVAPGTLRSPRPTACGSSLQRACLAASAMKGGWSVGRRRARRRRRRSRRRPRRAAPGRRTCLRRMLGGGRRPLLCRNCRAATRRCARRAR